MTSVNVLVHNTISYCSDIKKNPSLWPCYIAQAHNKSKGDMVDFNWSLHFTEFVAVFTST